MKYGAGDESIAHIDGEEVKKVEKSMKDVRNWYDKALNTLNSESKSQNPPIMSSEFTTRLNTLSSACDKIMDTPKPKPPPDEEPAKDTEKQSEAENNKGDSNPEENQSKTETPEQNAPAPPPQMDVD